MLERMEIFETTWWNGWRHIYNMDGIVFNCRRLFPRKRKKQIQAKRVPRFAHLLILIAPFFFTPSEMQPPTVWSPLERLPFWINLRLFSLRQPSSRIPFAYAAGMAAHASRRTGSSLNLFRPRRASFSTHLLIWGRRSWLVCLHPSTQLLLNFRIFSLSSGLSFDCPMWINMSLKRASWLLISVSNCNRR